MLDADAVERMAQKLAEFNEFNWQNCAQEYWKEEIRFVLDLAAKEGLTKGKRDA